MTRSTNDEITAGSGGPFRAPVPDLFSRGARDWLRHNEKVREAVRAAPPEIISNADVLGGGHRTVRVPVKLLEHYRFRLRQPESHTDAGQGARAGRCVRAPRTRPAARQGPGHHEPGGISSCWNSSIDDIVDWLWEELELPNLQARNRWPGRRGRHTRRLGPPRRAIAARPAPLHEGSRQATPRAGRVRPPTFTDDDLRYRQLVARAAAHNPGRVFFAMDVSGSMSEERSSARQDILLLGRAGSAPPVQYLETVFVAHTSKRGSSRNRSSSSVTGTGGTVASSAFEKVLERRGHALRPRAGTTSTCSTPPTARTPSRSRQPPRVRPNSVRSPASWDTWRSVAAPAGAARQRPQRSFAIWPHRATSAAMC